MKNWVALWFVSAVVAGPLAHAESTRGDVKHLIDPTGLNYHVTDSGNASISFGLEGDRGQVVYYTAKASILNGLALREVWSSAGQVPKDSALEFYRDLLLAGGNEPVGAWFLEETEDTYLLYFAVKVPETSASTDLRKVIERVAIVADAREATLSTKDEN